MDNDIDWFWIHGLRFTAYGSQITENCSRITVLNMLLMIDNYDSFTYNLVQYFGELGADIHVYRNDKITVENIEQLNPERIVISPGPCTPNEAGVSVKVIRHFAGKLPLLGVCLGHQSLAFAFGGEIIRAARLMHGKTSMVNHDGQTIFDGLPNPFEATRYHSLIVNHDSPRHSYAANGSSSGEIPSVRKFLKRSMPALVRIDSG